MKATDMLRAIRENVVAPAIDGAQRAMAPATHARDAMRAASDSSGAAPLHAFIRQGVDELSQVLNAFPDGVKPVAEAGQMFEPTSQLVTQEMTGKKLYMEMG